MNARREYEVVTRTRSGSERRHRYAPDAPLRPGDVLRLDGRYWLVEQVEPPRAAAGPARYRIRLRHPDGREELGAFRRYRPDAPRAGHSFTTLEKGQAVTWEVVGESLAHDGQEPYLDLVAERDHGERESELPDHELEHALAVGLQRLPVTASETLSRADSAGYATELVSLEPGEPPDWDEAQRYIDALTLDQIEDDLVELCGVETRHDPPGTWLETVKERLRSDLERFRTDVEGEHDEIEEWDFLDGRVFAAIGNVDDEADPASGFGWLCRLVDAGALGAAGFQRVYKPALQLSE
jgi:hypothetical protein